MRRNGVAAVDGLPEGVDFETVSKICSTHFGEVLQQTSYVPPSDWTAAGKYRLLLQTRSERLLSLVYKEAIFDEARFPALSRIRIAPGPPECAIYRSGSGQLLRYLPAVYLCDELIPRKHYRYVIEDLDQEYREPSSKDDFLLLTRLLPKIHLALLEWLESGGEDEFIRYEGAYLQSLHQFSRETIDAIALAGDSDAAKRIRSSWKRILPLLDRKNFLDFIPMRPIHGDFNPTNIRIHREDPDDIKLVDWEWAGIGIPHSDLASLMKGAPKQLEEEAVEMFIRRIKGWTEEDQWKLYWTCKLEGGLLDAAFLAAQVGEEIDGGASEYRAYIEQALQRALDAFERIK